MNSSATVIQISVNPNGGVPKHRVPQTEIHVNGVAGDKQRDLRYHGGPLRAVCLFSHERIRELQDEGHPIDCGTTGENLAIGGLDWDQVQPGDRLQIGAEVLLEVTQFTSPCRHIAASFIDGDFSRLSQKTHPGWSRVYAKVLSPGTVRENDVVQHLPQHD